jgi:hypothetical protein
LLGRYPTQILCARARSLHLIHCPLLHRIFSLRNPAQTKVITADTETITRSVGAASYSKFQQHVLVIHEFISGTGELAYQQNQGLHHLRLHSWCFLHRERRTFHED